MKSLASWECYLGTETPDSDLVFAILKSLKTTLGSALPLTWQFGKNEMAQVSFYFVEHPNCMRFL